jgi:hypothetical protein
MRITIGPEFVEVDGKRQTVTPADLVSLALACLSATQAQPQVATTIDLGHTKAADLYEQLRSKKP